MDTNSTINTEHSDKGIHFDSGKHLYLNSAGDSYISGTSFIGKFKNPFDTKFWLVYKATQRILETQGKIDLWKKIKMRYLMTDDKEGMVGNAKHFIKENEIESVSKIIEAEWKGETVKSLEKGSKYHDGEEKRLRTKYNFTHDWNNIDLSFPNIQKGIYPELRLYNHANKIAGSADVIAILKGGSFNIRDYKTNKKLEMDSWENPWTKSKAMMLYPLNDLPDCNFIHYTLQLSLYAWMLEELGYKCRKLHIDHVYLNANGKKKVLNPYPVKYLKSTILQMVDAYNKGIIGKTA